MRTVFAVSIERAQQLDLIELAVVICIPESVEAGWANGFLADNRVETFIYPGQSVRTTDG
jgi:hypothetical protein